MQKSLFRLLVWNLFPFVVETGANKTHKSKSTEPTYGNACTYFSVLVADDIKIVISISGRSWQAKVSSLRRSLRESGHNATVLTALDEIAWLFNMRGSDIPFNPVFKAYAVISEDQMVLYLEDQKQTSEIKGHLKSEVRISVGGWTYISFN